MESDVAKPPKFKITKAKVLENFGAAAPPLGTGGSKTSPNEAYQDILAEKAGRFLMLFMVIFFFGISVFLFSCCFNDTPSVFG